MIGASDTSYGSMPRFCGHCGSWHGPACPRVKAIEYYPDGTIKRVEYNDFPPFSGLAGSDATSGTG